MRRLSIAFIRLGEKQVCVMKLRVIRFGLALLFSAAGAGLCHADCAALYALAQRHAYDMARRNSLDHAGFMRHRGPAGGRVGDGWVGCGSPGRWGARGGELPPPPLARANMLRGGCQAVASAVSASGRRYWVMEIGGGGGGGAGRDFSIEGSNAPEARSGHFTFAPKNVCFLGGKGHVDLTRKMPR